MKHTINEIGLPVKLFNPATYIDAIQVSRELEVAQRKIEDQKEQLLNEHQFLEETIEELHFVKNLSEKLASSLDFQETSFNYFNAIDEVITPPFVLSLLTFSAKGPRLTILSSIELDERGLKGIEREVLENYNKQKGNRSLQPEGTTIYYSSPEKLQGLSLSHLEKNRSYRFTSTLEVGGEEVGLLHMIKYISPLSSKEERLIDASLNPLELALKNAIAHERALDLASKDGLTGVFNRRVFQEVLKREYQRADRYGTPLSLILIDIDHFKKINDTYGHQAGDRVLQKVSTEIGKHIRETDLFARYGGEEFALILPETSRRQALATARKICRVIEGLKISDEGREIKVTISLGVSSLERKKEEPPITSAEEMIKSADNALYAAKNSGRNRALAA